MSAKIIACDLSNHQLASLSVSLDWLPRIEVSESHIEQQESYTGLKEL